MWKLGFDLKNLKKNIYANITRICLFENNIFLHVINVRFTACFGSRTNSKKFPLHLTDFIRDFYMHCQLCCFAQLKLNKKMFSIAILLIVKNANIFQTWMIKKSLLICAYFYFLRFLNGHLKLFIQNNGIIQLRVFALQICFLIEDWQLEA